MSTLIRVKKKKIGNKYGFNRTQIYYLRNVLLYLKKKRENK
jgi:hypothetical protein